MSSSSSTISLTFTGPRQLAVGPAPTPARGPGEVRIRPRFVGVCATDVEMLDGVHPYFAAGLAEYPLQPGHEWSGVVVESDDPRLPPGTHVVGDPEVPCGRADCEYCTVGRTPWCPDRTETGCRGGRAGGATTSLVLPAGALHVIPEGLGDDAAVLAEPALTVLGGLHRAGELRGRTTLIVGAGTLGTIAAQVAMSRGADVTILETSAVRRAALDEFDVRPELGPGDRFDVVLVAAGSAAAFTAGFAAVANGGALVLLGVPGEPVDDVDVASILHRDMTIHGVLNYSTVGPGAMAEALKLLADGVIDPATIIDTTISLSDATSALERARDPERARPKVLLAIPEAEDDA